MTLYARPSWRLARQVFGDLFLIAWGIGWWVAGRAIDSTVRALAAPARQAAASASDLSRQLADAAAQAANIPFVGENLAKPFQSMQSSIGGLQGAASDQVRAIETTATIAGWTVFAIPVLLLIAYWVPRRVRFMASAHELRKLAAQPQGTELLALRALANRPLHDLQRAASDPMAAWRQGDPDAIARLAALELRASGVSDRQMTSRVRHASTV